MDRSMRPDEPPPPPPPPLLLVLQPIWNHVPLKSDGCVPKADGSVVVVPPKSRYIDVALFGGKV